MKFFFAVILKDFCIDNIELCFLKTNKIVLFWMNKAASISFFSPLVSLWWKDRRRILTKINALEHLTSLKAVEPNIFCSLNLNKWTKVLSHSIPFTKHQKLNISSIHRCYWGFKTDTTLATQPCMYYFALQLVYSCRWQTT